MKFLRRNRTPQTDTRPDPEMLTRTPERLEACDPPRPGMLWFGPFSYPESPREIAQDPMLANAFIKHAERVSIAECAKFLAIAEPPYNFMKIRLLYNTFIKVCSPLQVNISCDLRIKGYRLARIGRADQNLDGWASFYDECVNEVSLIMTANRRRPELDFYKSSEFAALHEARVQEHQKRCR